MKTKRIADVTEGNITLHVAPHPKGWRLRYKEPASGTWKAIVRKDRDEAIEEAKRKAVELSGSYVDDFASLSRDELDLLRRFRDGGFKHADIDVLKTFAGLTEISFADAAVEFVANLKGRAGASHHNARNNGIALRHLSRIFGRRIMHTLTTAEMAKWLDGRDDISARSRKNFRDVLVGFFKWARDARRYLPENLRTAAEKIPAVKVARKTPSTYSPEEFKTILREVRPAYIAWPVLAGFASIRVEEIFNNPLGDKSPLDWSDFKWNEGVIRIRPETSKTNTLRLVPITPVVRAWLYPMRKTSGRLVPKVLPHVNHGKGVDSETHRIGKKLDGGWKKNALRHSSISYRVADVGTAMAALEAGNSEAETRRSYLSMKTEAEAAAWFSLTPDVVLKGKKAPAFRVIKLSKAA